LSSVDKSDGKDVKFLDRPQVLIFGALVSLAVLVAIFVFFGDLLGNFLNFPNVVNHEIADR
jgi:hypothetical protein